MKQRTLRLALLAALTLQVAILAGVFVNGFYPLWLGTMPALLKAFLEPSGNPPGGPAGSVSR